MSIKGGGNVGIGTLSPSEKLTISGSININSEGSYMGIDAQATPRLGFVKLSGAQPFLAFAQSSFNLRVSSGTTIATSNTFSPVLTVKTTGEVGIGTTDPQSKLDVAINDNGYATALTVRNTNAGTSALSQIILETASNTSGVFAIRQFNSAGHVEIANYANAGMHFWTSGSERMRIHANGKVSVNNTDNTAGQFSVSNNASVTAYNTTFRMLEGATFKNDAVIGWNVAGQYSHFGNYQPLALALRTNDQNRIWIAGGGNVGIGTTDSTAKLTLGANNFIMVSTDSGGKAGILFSETGTPTATNVQYGAKIFYDEALDLLQLSTRQNNVDKLGIVITRADGNIGIGTTSPGNKLSIVTDAGADDIIPALGSNGGKLSLLNSGGLYGLISGVLGSGNGYLQVQRVDGGATAYNLLLQPNGGNVGIGTTAPGTYKLYVAGTIYATGDVIAYSDESVKENIRPIENVIEKIQSTRGIIYDRIDTETKDNIGFIAQELEVAFPELVVTNEDGTKAVKYQNAVAVLFEAIKDQQKQIDAILKVLDNGITK
jgi:hypothetical protein